MSGNIKLTPENYIRKKARSLPIYECWVNLEWNTSKMATVVVARQHTTQNITYGTYLVDLLCLGVKDTAYKFNLPLLEYKEFMEQMSNRSKMLSIPYSLAHNIVYAGLEFADEFGFNPHKDFTQTSKYILENDDESIELIEIECGMKGIPAFMRGPFDDEAKVKRILAQLEKGAGAGNYQYFTGPDSL